MTDHQVRSLKQGDRIIRFSEDRMKEFIIADVCATGDCENKASGALGHAYAQVRVHSPSMILSVLSDEYLAGAGLTVYRGVLRVNGWVLAKEPFIWTSHQSQL